MGIYLPAVKRLDYEPHSVLEICQFSKMVLPAAHRFHHIIDNIGYFLFFYVSRSGGYVLVSYYTLVSHCVFDFHFLYELMYLIIFP